MAIDSAACLPTWSEPSTLRGARPFAGREARGLDGRAVEPCSLPELLTAVGQMPMRNRRRPIGLLASWLTAAVQSRRKAN